MRKFFLFLFVLFLLTYHPITQLPNHPVTCLYAVENLNLTETKLATIPEDYPQVNNITFRRKGDDRRKGREKGTLLFKMTG